MIARVLLVWLSFSIVLLMFALYSQGEPFELQHFVLALITSLPVAVAVLRGGLGDANQKELQYPSLTLMIVSAWILIVGPSMVVESRTARFLYHYSDASLTLARLFFVGWCLLFTVATGRPRLKELNVRPGFIDFVACASFAAVIAAYLLQAGIFSFYQSGRDRLTPEAGGAESFAMTMGLPLFTLLPPMLFLLLVRMQARATQYFLVFLGFLASWGVLFLLGSRTILGVAVASCLLLCRALSFRFRANVLFALGVAVPAALILILVYRNALSSSEEKAENVSEYISIASQATGSLNETNAQVDAINLVSNNMHVRLWYGQQFCVVIDEWLDEGAAMRGTLFSGFIASLPTMLMSEKNAIATDLNFEQTLVYTGRFPAIDLAPTPWMQWLYELGILGLFVGALLYAWIVRVIEYRVTATRSFYEVMLWLNLFVAVLAPEHSTDLLLMPLRTSIVQWVLIGGAARAARLLASLGGRRALSNA